MPPPKNQRQDRKRNDRRGSREPSEYDDVTLSVDRVTRVVKGGRRMRFRAVVIVGNRKGKVGLGTGKATEVQAAVQKANRSAKRSLITVPIRGATIPHEVNIKHKAARLRLMPASPGTGIVAGGPLRIILDLAGVRDILAKRFGGNNKLVNAQAAMKALSMLRPVKGKNVAPEAVLVAASSDAPEELESSLPVTQVKATKAEHEKQQGRKSFEV